MFCPRTFEAVVTRNKITKSPWRPDAHGSDVAIIRAVVVECGGSRNPDVIMLKLPRF